MIIIDYRDSRPIYEQVVEKFKLLILKGVLTRDEKMPSVRTLAMELSINPNTIQRAYRELESQGWVVSVPGKGSFVAAVSEKGEDPSRQLLQEFDNLCARLRALGISRQTLIRRMEEGGEDHA